MPDTLTTPPRRLIDVRAFAAKIGASTRHALRLADSGAAPWGMKLGALRRWDLAEIDAWIARGCPPVRTPGRTS